MMEKNIKLEEVSNKREREILQLLKKRKQCMYGEIIKELSYSYTEGQKHISSLLSKGWIDRVNMSSFFRLNTTIS